MNCDKKTLKFNLSNKDLKIKELISGDFLELEVYAISDDYPNRNESHFTLDSMNDAIPTCYNKPVLGAFNEEIGPMGDFESHNDNGLHYDSELDTLYYDYTSADSEIPLGMIRESDSVEVVYDTKTKKNWLKLTCCLWCKYNFKAIKSLLKSRKGTSKISVEIEVLDSHYDENGIEIITKFALMGFTILGQRVAEGIENAHLSVIDLMETAIFQKKQKALCYAYSALDNYENIGSLESVKDFDDIQKEALSSDIIDNEGVEEIEMNQENQEGGKQKMLTYEMKRSLLESYLRDNLSRDNEDCECCCWAWVCDLDETNVYFEFDNKYYRASYSIVEAETEEGNSEVYIDIDGKEQVIRSWSTFAEESCGPKTEETKCENAEGAEENKEELAEDDPEDDPEDDANDDPEDDANDDPEDDANDDPEDSPEDDPEDKEENYEENKEENKSEFDKGSEEDPINLDETPSEVDTDNLSTEQIIETSTESIAAPDVQIDAEQLGDANAELNQSVEGMEVPAVEAVVDGELSTVSESICVGPDGQQAEVVNEVQPEAKEENPDDNSKEGLFEVKTEIQTVEVNATVELNGESVDVNTLLEKYNQLKDEFDALNLTVRKQQAQNLVDFGVNFINNEPDVDAESRADYIAQVTEKCESFEFTTEEEVTKFAKSLLAMYYYEHRAHKKETEEFSISIERSTHTNAASKKTKLKEAISKLNNI